MAVEAGDTGVKLGNLALLLWSRVRKKQRQLCAYRCEVIEMVPSGG